MASDAGAAEARVVPGSSGNALTTVLRRRGSVLALVLAGGEGSRLGPLTENRAKPAVPFAGSYRLIDFVLSNCHHSRVSDVWVLQQYDPRVLTDHLSNGRPWDLDRTYGGLRVVHPSLGDDDESGFYSGNADAIWRSCTSIQAFDPELVLVLSADAVYRLDYGEVLERHLEAGAEVTMVTTEVPREQAARFGVVELDGERVRGFEYKPERPRTNIVATEVFVYEAQLLLDTLAELAEGEEELRDFGNELLPRLVERGKAHSYALAGYWRDVGTLESYWEGHMDLLGTKPMLDLDDADWPILTWGVPQLPARIHEGARLTESLISPGARVAGEVSHSVLGPGVVVEPGASVRRSVLLHGAVVAADAVLEQAVVEADARVGGSIGGNDELVAVAGDGRVLRASELG
jgi:glucose-1-phosphate adenylyltransferase